jgi:hypothetical protein
MKKCTLEKSNLEVSALGLGCGARSPLSGTVGEDDWPLGRGDDKQESTHQTKIM